MRLAAPALLAVLLAAAPAAARGPHREGDVVPIAGRVTDASGRPLAGVTVLLEVSRARYLLRKLDVVVSDTLTVPTTTDADGRYSFDWRWDPYYNTFWLAVALPVERGGRPGYEIFHRVDAAPVVAADEPTELPVVVADTGYLEWLRRFLDGRASDDERRVFREMGRPERVSEAGGETSWWYFRAGRAYHFADGQLRQVVPFEPIEPL